MEDTETCIYCLKLNNINMIVDNEYYMEYWNFRYRESTRHRNYLCSEYCKKKYKNLLIYTKPSQKMTDRYGYIWHTCNNADKCMLCGAFITCVFEFDLNYCHHCIIPIQNKYRNIKIL